MKNKILFALILLSVLSSCSRNPFVPPGQYNYVDAELKASFNFWKNTWWIYRDSLTGRIDSFYVYRNVTGTSSTTPHNPNESVHNEYIDISIAETNVLNASTNPMSLDWSWMLQSKSIYLSYKSKTLNYVRVDLTFPFQETTLPDSGRYCRFHSTYEVNGRSFSNVIEVNNFPKPIYGSTTKPTNYYDVFYVCAEAGIIKMRLSHPNDSFALVWELQRWSYMK